MGTDVQTQTCNGRKGGRSEWFAHEKEVALSLNEWVYDGFALCLHQGRAEKKGTIKSHLGRGPVLSHVSVFSRSDPES